MKRLSPRSISLLVVIGVFLLALLILLLLPPRSDYRFPPALRTKDEGTTDLSDRAIVAGEDFAPESGSHSRARTVYHDLQMTVDESFTSNLPIVVLDTGGSRPHRQLEWSSEYDSYVLKSDAYEYVEGTMKLLSRAKGTNTLLDKPAAESSILIRIRGNSSVNYDKHQYLLKLTDANGKANRQDLLYMGADSEWILNCSFIDKSLLRNYLAYTVAGQLNEYTPDVRYCELVWKDGDEYHYDGVYLLCESVKVSKSRVNLPRFSENAQNLPFLLRRDRYNPNGVMLENYAERNQLLYGGLEVKWPEESRLNDQVLSRITAQIDGFEEALFAEDYEDFIRYRDYIDVDSFVDYLILNEYFANYDAGFNSTYIYSDYSGKLHMGPVWDYDGAVDNYQNESLKTDSTAFHDAPWFRQILRDPEFTVDVMERYAELRESILSDESLDEFIDATVAGLGSAVDRDWARWGYFYRDGSYLKNDDGDETDRNTETYGEEIEKIKTVLAEHSAWLDEHFDSLYQFCDPNAPQPADDDDDSGIRRGHVLAVVYMTIFFISVILVQRMDRGL